MNIQLCEPKDLDRMLEVYEEAIAFQKTRSPFSWHRFEAASLTEEIRRKELYKVLINKQTGCVFRMLLNDPAIWKEKDAVPSVYLHRISVGDGFHGLGIMHAILEWAKRYCKTHHRMYVRIDTWGLNKKLTDYYKALGFSFVETREVRPEGGLEPYYNGVLSMFQLKV